MILFSKDKGIIFKITNAILLIWLIVATVFTLNIIIRMVVPEPQLSYNEYRDDYCWDFKFEQPENMTAAEREELCQENYENYKEDENYKLDEEKDNYERWISLFTALSQVIIIGGVLIFINKKRVK